MPHNTNIKEDLHIAIIGAGIAGLSCAFHLANNDFSNISIYEAQDKIGGRILTATYKGICLELGAQWIHGKSNSLYDFSKAYKLLPAIQKHVFEGKGLFCTSDGEVIDNNLIEKVKQVVSVAKVKIDMGKYEAATQKSVKTFLTEEFNTYALNTYDKSTILLERDIFNWFLKFEVIDNACDDLSDVALQSFTEWDDCPDEMYHITFNSGFQSVLDTLSSRIPNGKIHLNMPIQTIEWNEHFTFENGYEKHINGNFPVMLKSKNRNIYADTVILTSSIGFLNKNADTFFSPPLPQNKLKAISKIGFGTVNKIFLIYEKSFWDLKDHGFQLVWKSKKGKCEKLYSKNPWITGITGFDVLDKNSNVLLGWIGGKEAKVVENTEEEIIGNVCTELLRIFLNNPDIPNPSKTFRSKWHSNPYIQGSYSYRTPCYYKNETTLEELQAPLCCKYVLNNEEFQWPIVLFSGEATDEQAFSSAHGAFQSGIRAAESLIKSFSQISKKL